jgi:hypothetical protein
MVLGLQVIGARIDWLMAGLGSGILAELRPGMTGGRRFRSQVYVSPKAETAMRGRQD